MTDVKLAMETTREIYQMLSDEESRKIYRERLIYAFTKDSECASHLGEVFLKSDPFFIAAITHRFVFQLLNELPRDKNVVLYGTGADGLRLLPDFIHDERFVGFCGQNKEKQKKGYLGYPVMSPEELLSRKDLSVVVATSDYRDEIMQILTEGGYPQELVFDGPAYYKPDKGTMEQYFGPDFMSFDKDEVFVDAGCYDFGSTLALAKRCGRVKKVYAFEPDPKNYKRCLRRAEKWDRNRISDVEIFQSGVWSKETMLSFDAMGTASSSVRGEGVDGCDTVAARTIDGTVDLKERVTMIKMDIEGSELEALKGARETILRDRPKLAICIYHKPEDLWEIPAYIKELVPEYRLYIRHHSFEMAETVLYAIMPEECGKVSLRGE